MAKRYISPLGGSYEVGPEGRVSNRDQRLVVLVSLEEYVEIKSAAHNSGTTASTWARALLLKGLDDLDRNSAVVKAMKARYGIRDDDPLEPVSRVQVNRTGLGPRHGSTAPDVVDLDAGSGPANPLGSLLSDFDDDGPEE